MFIKKKLRYLYFGGGSSLFCAISCPVKGSLLFWKMRVLFDFSGQLVYNIDKEKAFPYAVC